MGATAKGIALPTGTGSSRLDANGSFLSSQRRPPSTPRCAQSEARIKLPRPSCNPGLIIGGGVTGTALARDLALRGVDCILVERDDINAGASGRNHGLLHSGARYVAGDREAAMECRAEGDILKRMAAQTIQDTGGYFVASARGR